MSFYVACGLVLAVALIALTFVWRARLRLNLLQWANVLTPHFLVAPINSQSALAILLAPSAIVGGRQGLRRPLVRVVVAMIVVQVVAVAWSPSIGTASRSILAMLDFLVSLLLAWRVLQDGGDPLRTVLLAAAPLLVASTATTLLFRYDPGLESGYLHSDAARFLLGDDATLLYTTQPNNVVESYKAGGLFFVNGNQASLFHGLTMFAYLALGFSSRRDRRFAWIMAALCAIGVLATGSKTGILLLLVLPVAVLAVRRLLRSQVKLVWFAFFIAVAIAVYLVSLALLDQLSTATDTTTGRVDNADDTLGIRYRIWAVALRLFLSHPFAGLGFGGWDIGFAQDPAYHTFVRVFPPHDLVIAAWSDASLVNAVLLVLFFVVAIVQAVRVVARAVDQRVVEAAMMLLGSVLWILVHGLGDNTDLYGVFASIAIVAAELMLLDRWHSSLPVPRTAGAHRPARGRPRYRQHAAARPR